MHSSGSLTLFCTEVDWAAEEGFLSLEGESEEEGELPLAEDKDSLAICLFHRDVLPMLIQDVMTALHIVAPVWCQ